MKEWWINLNLREKQMVYIGGTILVFVILYEILWTPFSNINTSLREEITHSQKLLVFMQETDTRIRALEKMSQHTSAGQTSAALLSILQKEVNQSVFAKNLTSLTQAENNSVQITLQKVNFDELITWLTMLWKKQGVTVTQITVTPNGALGIVDAVVILE